MVERNGKMPRLSKNIPCFFKLNAFSDSPTFIGLARRDETEEKTVMTGIIFDRPLGKINLPRIVRDETSDWSLLEVGDSDGDE